jgi:hypothetical protein
MTEKLELSEESEWKLILALRQVQKDLREVIKLGYPKEKIIVLIDTINKFVRDLPYV